MDEARRNRVSRDGQSRWLCALTLAICACGAADRTAAYPPLPLSLSPPAPSAAAPRTQPVVAPLPPIVTAPQFTPAPDEATSQLRPWWAGPVAAPLKGGAAPRPIDLEAVVLQTLAHSAQVRVLSETPVIRKQAICEAQSRFDVRSFMESKFVDTSEPVGSLLTTGGANRYIDQNFR